MCIIAYDWIYLIYHLRGKRMKLLWALSVSTMAALYSGPAFADTIVHVDGIQNSSSSGSNAVNVTLSPGTYVMTFVGGSDPAFSRFASTGGCDVNGTNCAQGYETSAVYIVNGTSHFLGAGGGYGPIDPGDGYYDTPQKALANASAFSATLNLSSTTVVGFYLGDDYVPDNRGGVNISITRIQGAETVTYSYDALGRLVRAVHRGGPASGTQVNYEYDKASNRARVLVTGAPQ